MILGYIAISAVFIITALVTCGVIKEKHYPWCVWLMALGMVYSTTLLGIYVVGSDIQGEIYASRQTLIHGMDFANTNSPSVISVAFAPWLSQILSLDIIWVYKAILPLFLSVAPVFLYFAYKAQMGGMKAYFATLFFIIMPTYSMEIATIGKSMVAEMFYAFVIFAMVSDWKWYYKGMAITFGSMAVIVSHYTIGVILLANLGVIFAVRLVTNWSKWNLLSNRKVPVWLLPILLVVTVGFFYLIFSQMTGGWINHLVSNITQGYISKVTNVGTMVLDRLTINKAISTKVMETAPPVETLDLNYIYKQTHLTQVGLGLDFIGQPIEGKIFRGIQYITQLLIIMGLVYLLFRSSKYKFTAEFVAGIGCSFAMLFACMFLPGFSNLINMSRFYHASLFYLAPMLIVGCDCTANMIRWASK